MLLARNCGLSTSSNDFSNDDGGGCGFVITLLIAGLLDCPYKRGPDLVSISPSVVSMPFPAHFRFTSAQQRFPDHRKYVTLLRHALVVAYALPAFLDQCANNECSRERERERGRRVLLTNCLLRHRHRKSHNNNVVPSSEQPSDSISLRWIGLKKSGLYST